MLFQILLAYLTIGAGFVAYIVWSGDYGLKVEIIKTMIAKKDDILNKEIAEYLGMVVLVITLFGWLPMVLSRLFRDTSERKKAVELYKDGKENEAIKIIEQQK